MQTPFHKFFLSIILSYSICCSLEGHAADITVPQGIYDGETLTAPFPYTVIGDPRGTTVVPAGNLILKNLDNSIAALPLSCFGNLAGNFTIDGNGYSLTFENIRTATNGAALSNSAAGSGLFIVQDFDELLFSNCNSLLSALPQTGQQTTTPTPSSGTIYSKSDLILKNIQNFSFYSNLVSGDGGAIDAQSLTIQGVKKLCVFQENTAQSDGGACQVTKNFLATDNPAPVAFVGNVAGIKGGGLAAVKDGQNGQTPGAGAATDLSVSFSKNTAVEFDGNVARIGGGIYSDGPISFLENAKTVFLNNVSAPVYINPSQPQGGGQQATGDQANYGDGGAIFCKNGNQQPQPPQQGAAASGEVSFQGEGMVFFSKNIAAGKGGAIYAKKLSISDCGPVQFIGNIANDGGAIYLADSGELSLSADHGDIIFDANLKRTAQQGAATVNDVQVASNAISMATGGQVTILRASEGHQILFNDPIVMANGQNPTQTLKVNDGEGYSGDIVFAKGESVLYSDIELVQGKILLREKAKLSVNSLNQTGGIVYMEAGTTLDFVNGAQQPQPTKPISLTNLHLSLASLLESNGVTNPPAAQTPTPAVIGNTNNGSVTISGQIFFEDLDNTSYDKYEWLGANQTLDVLKLQMGAQPPAQAPADLTLGSENPQYGYQGNWKLRWEPDPAAQPQQNNIYTLKATWTKTGYNPGPERVASLVPNSLWGSIFDVRSAHSAIQASIDGRAYCRGLWISGISNFFYHDRDALGQGYRHISGGYAIGANSYFGSSMFGVAFTEMFGRSKDYVVCRSNDHACIGTVYLSTKKALCGSCVFGETFMRASYGFGNQHMKTSYTFAEENDVRWDNNCLVGEIGAGLPIVIAPSKLYLNELHPFVRAEFAYADHESFTEEGDQAREFKSGHLMNLTIPVGVKFDRCSSKHPNKYSFMGAYICDAYRSISGTKTTLLSHQESWTTDAFHLGRHGAMVRGSMYASLTNNIEVYGHGRYEYRNASRGYGLSVGSKVRF